MRILLITIWKPRKGGIVTQSCIINAVAERL